MLLPRLYLFSLVLVLGSDELGLGILHSEGEGVKLKTLLMALIVEDVDYRLKLFL